MQKIINTLSLQKIISRQSMKNIKLILIVFTLLFIQSCVNTKVIDVKSPCVSGKNGPCGPRIPVNTWLEEYRS